MHVGCVWRGIASGVAVLVMYETGAAYHDMETRKVSLFVCAIAWFDMVQVGKLSDYY